MHVRTPRAAVWIDEPAEDHPDPSADRGRRPPGPAPTTREARKPFDGALGRYIALRHFPPAQAGGPALLLVAVANKSPTQRGPWWVKAEHALTEREAAQWARDGF